MNDMSRPVKEVLIALLRNKGVTLRYLEVRKRVATVDIDIKCVHTGPRSKKTRINACKIVRVELTKLASQAQNLRRLSGNRNSYEICACSVVYDLVRKHRAEGKAKARSQLDKQHPTIKGKS